MDPAAFNQWVEDRAQSDDEVDEALALHLTQVFEAHEEDEAMQRVLERKHGGSRPRRIPNLAREHVVGHTRIWDDYFSPNPKYPPHLFHRRFRMRKTLFMKIHDKVLESCRYFVQRPDAIGNPGLSSIQKMTATMRMMTLGIAGDAMDEYIQIGESTAIATFKQFVAGIVEVFEEEYLRAPTQDDVRKQMEINRTRGFVGMFGSLDCTHWLWKNFPVGQQGQYRNKDGENSIVLEAIATRNLWIWHAFVGIPGSNNDINILDRSPLLVNLLIGVAPSVSYSVNGHSYNMYYLLTNGIYPDYTIFVKTIADPQGAKWKWFAKRQEGVRKDVERCFGVLQARFAMVRNPARWWSQDQMQTVWKATIILHNMIIEDEEGDPELSHEYLFDNSEVQWQHRPRPPLSFARLTHSIQRIGNAHVANQLKDDLVEHLWQLKGEDDD